MNDNLPPVHGRIVMRVRNAPTTTATTCTCGTGSTSKPEPVVLEPQSDGTYGYATPAVAVGGPILLPARDGWAHVVALLTSVAACLTLIVGFALLLRDPTPDPAPSRLPVHEQSWSGQDTDELIQGAFHKVIDMTHRDER